MWDFDVFRGFDFTHSAHEQGVAADASFSGGVQSVLLFHSLVLLRLIMKVEST